MDWNEILSKVLVGFLTAGAASWLTVHLALKRFRSEKWWKKRGDAYTGIMEALHHIKEQVENQRAAEHHGATLPKELKEKLGLNVEKATAEIRLRRDVGSFVISAEAVTALDLLLADLSNALDKGLGGDRAAYFADRISAADRAMASVREIARAHLKLP